MPAILNATSPRPRVVPLFLMVTMASLATLAALVLLAAPARAQAAPRPVPCQERDEARQLDFWIGTWDVLHPETGDTMGVNVIEPALDGCALMERWTGAGGSSGQSMNFYDPQRRTWRQVWVSDRGNVLDYRQGELGSSGMRFQGLTISPAGDTTHQQLTFTPVATDTVRQVFEVSLDRGASWETTWVGVYVRRGGSPGAR